MAIKNFLRQGSYTKITEINLNFEGEFLRFKLSIFKNSEKKPEDLISKTNYRLIGGDFQSFFDIKKISEKDSNLIKCIYQYLKGKEEFKNTEDC